LDAITEALEDYVRANGRLPCPASRRAVAGDVTYGREVLADCGDASEPALTKLVGGIRIGALPFRDIWLRDTYAMDGYGNRFLYAVRVPFTTQAGFSSPTVVGTITVKDGADIDILTDAAYVVLSHGPDGKGARRGELDAASAAPCGASANLD